MTEPESDMKPVNKGSSSLFWIVL